MAVQYLNTANYLLIVQHYFPDAYIFACRGSKQEWRHARARDGDLSSRPTSCDETFLLS